MATAGVSVVIPAYGAAAFIDRAVRSVLAQTLGEFEVVIVSDDGTDYVRRLAGVGVGDPRIRGASTNGFGTGPANARNTGLDAARGSIIATLDADDRIEPTYLEVLVPAAREYGAAYSRRRFIDMTSGEELDNFDRPIPTGLVTLDDVLTSQIHSYAGIVFDRTRMHARWPPWEYLWEDVYFFVRCFDDLPYLWHVAEPLYDYFRNPESICSSPTAGQDHLDSARQLVALIDAGDAIGIRNASSRETYHRYLLSRAALEAAFVRAESAGEVKDFHSFIRRNLLRFHSLDDPDRLRQYGPAA